MVLDIERRSSPGQDLALAGDDVRWLDLITELGHTAVDRDQPGLDQSISFTPRTDPLFREELIDTDRLSHGESASSPDTQTGCQQGRSERRRESYVSMYVERLSEARTKRTTCFSIRLNGRGDRP